VKRSALIILSFLGLALLLSCGKSSKKVVIEEPQYTSPGNPFFVPDSEDEVEDDIINPTYLSKDDPCFSYLRNSVVGPVATCTELENGRIKDSYKSTIFAGGLCLLRKPFPGGLGLYTLVGVISESQKGGPRKNLKVDILGNGESKDLDLLRFEMKGEVKSFVKYSLSENSVTVRSISKLWKKKYRYYRFSCKKINPIID
jgi:hypothetical protein